MKPLDRRHDIEDAAISTVEDAHAEPAWYAVHTVSGGELAAWEGLEELGVEPFLPAWKIGNVRAVGRENPAKLREAVFFPRYVLLRVAMVEELRQAIEDVEAVQYVLGTKASGPSPIPDAQIALIRSLLGMERRPELGDMPEKGRRATVISGPMKGLEGLVTWRNKTHAKLATEIALMGRAVEITAPLDVLVLSEYVTAEGRFRPRRRGGKRARRSQRRDVA